MNWHSLSAFFRASTTKIVYTILVLKYSFVAETAFVQYTKMTTKTNLTDWPFFCMLQQTTFYFRPKGRWGLHSHPYMIVCYSQQNMAILTHFGTGTCIVWPSMVGLRFISLLLMASAAASVAYKMNGSKMQRKFYYYIRKQIKWEICRC